MATKDNYLQYRQIAPILLAFLVFALPLSYVQISTSIPPDLGRALTFVYIGYLVLLGNTHFAITWALYLNSANVRYFQSSPGRRIIYFLMPVSIMVLFFAIGVMELPESGTSFFISYTVAIAAVDYFHVVRQSFGVFQMVKRNIGVALPRRVATLDNRYFLSLWVLQVLTFLDGVDRGFDGRFDPSQPVTQISVAVAAVLFVQVLRGLYTAWRQAGADRAAVLTSLVYLLFQSASALLVVYRSRLYVASLAMHYVEYHVLMAPRLFTPELDPSSRLDRISGWFRRHKVVFYAALASIGVVVSAGALFGLAGVTITSDNSRFGWLFINLLNGIFLSHYFIEAFVWRFGNPFYRDALAPIYFPSPQPPRRGRAPRRSARTTARPERAPIRPS